MWTFAQAVDARSSLESGLMLMGVGVLVVFAALFVIGELTALLSWVFRQRPDLADATPAPAVEAEGFPTPPPASVDEIDAKTLAVIAAAAATAVGLKVPIRVRRVTRVLHPPTGGSAWAEAGRMDLQSSHHVRR